jgi:dihydrofolate synthase/folylpolyglutamate synthase
MRFNTLNEWLDWQFSLHPRKMELGLTRIRTVAQRLNLLPPLFSVITVAGTNGKGSSVIMLDAILTAAGFRVGRFISPHVFRYNERICVANQEASDSQLCHVFQLIEEVRDDISLTFFEFCTLAAMLVFQQEQVDIAVLEVGLGGRLDAVNIFDAEIALITTIDIDHVDWLGDNREQIGLEKAGILRAHRPAVCVDANPPQSLIQYAEQLETPLYCLGRDFSYQKNQPIDSNQTWNWRCHQANDLPNHEKLCQNLVDNNSFQIAPFYTDLPLPYLPGDFQLQNAAGVLTVITLLNQAKKHLRVSEQAIHQGLKNAKLPGRFQCLPGKIIRIFDVAHNPLGAQVLAQSLHQHPCQGKTHVVMGMLENKDIAGFLKNMHGIEQWYVAPLNVGRSATAQCLVEHLLALGAANISSYISITFAYQQALSQAGEGDRIVITGSFHSVSEVLLAELK